jgi:hypothetical protein
MVLACLVTGCSGNGDDKGDGSTAGASSGSDSSTSRATDGSTPLPTTGVSEKGNGDGTDPMQDDKGAPGSVDAKGRQTFLFKRIPGNRTGACQDVGKERDVKSGGFMGGSFADARASYGKKRPGMKPKQVRLYWIPVHSKPMRGVTVSATSGGDPVRLTTRDEANAEQWQFYDTVIALPHDGTWTFKVSSGPDRGCFVARF